jgi:hypothetical protein
MRADHKIVGLTLLYMSNTLQKVIDITVCDYSSWREVAVLYQL